MDLDSVLDAVVIGAGPAGSTVANLLARAGHRVLAIEKAVFPRFHIGESLLPADIKLFERLGWNGEKEGHLIKRGAWFIDESTGQSKLFRFDQALNAERNHAFQVDRSRFDHELMELARTAGAVVHEGETVTNIQVSDDGVDVESSRARYQTRFLVDASGQQAFLGRSSKSIQPISGMGKAAVFRRYLGINSDVQRELYERGDIRILMLDDGWCWIIPLRGAELSVGMVRSKGPVNQDFFARVHARSPMLQRLTRGATELPINIVSNFAYRNLKASGKRYACVGDSACFLDPVFSSGVTLALLGAERLADLLSPALKSFEEGDPDLMAPWHQHMERAYQCFERFILRFYQTNLVHNLFFAEEPLPEVVQGVTSVLAADVWRDDNVFQEMLLQARRLRSR